MTTRNSTTRLALYVVLAAVGLALLAVVPSAVVLAGYLESDFGREQPVRPEPRPQPPPVPPPRPVPLVDNPSTRLVRAVEVGQPIRWGNMVLFPLTLPGGEPVARIHSLGTAVDRGWVTIEEDKPATVGRAVLVNRSDNLVLVLAGELIKGGQQHRSSQKDLLLLPHSRVPIDLYCVEQGRWSGPAKFEAARALAPQSVRAGNVAGESQDRVWADIRSFNEAAKAASPSQSLMAGLDSDAVQKELAECRRHVVPHLPRNCIGLVAGRAGQIFAADAFVDQDLFDNYRHMLIDSYAGQEVYYRLVTPVPRPVPGPVPEPMPPGMERDRIRPIPIPPPPGRDQARLFLDQVLRASFEALPTPGGGSLWRIGGPATGQALDYRGQSVHVALTHYVVVPVVRPVPPPRRIPMPEPRDRQERDSR